MNKKQIILLAICASVILAVVYWQAFSERKPLTSSINQLTKEVAPSQTLTQYSDPSGFTLSYPDNLSITKWDIEDNITYADIQLSSKDVNGSLSLKITDSNFFSLDAWIKSNTNNPKNSKTVKLGNLEAREIKLEDRLLLGALDQGILFTVEVPLVEEKFWSKVYTTVLSNFSFAAPETASSGDTVSADDVSFEGEEVVE